MNTALMKQAAIATVWALGTALFATGTGAIDPPLSVTPGAAPSVNVSGDVAYDSPPCSPCAGDSGQAESSTRRISRP